MTYRCTVLGTEVSFDVSAGERVLHEMIRSRADVIKVGCRGGGCGACRVQVIEGDYSTRRMSRRHVTEADEADGIVLACRLVPTTDLLLEPAPFPSRER